MAPRLVRPDHRDDRQRPERRPPPGPGGQQIRNHLVARLALDHWRQPFVQQKRDHPGGLERPDDGSQRPPGRGDHQRPRPGQQQRLVVDDVCRAPDELGNECDGQGRDQAGELRGEQIVEHGGGRLVAGLQRQPESQGNQAAHQREQRDPAGVVLMRANESRPMRVTNPDAARGPMR